MTEEPKENRSFPVRKLPESTIWADSTPLDRATGQPVRPYSRRRIRLGLSMTLIGYVLFLVGARPSLFGVDRSPIIGFVQIAVFLIGLAFICLGGYISMMALWKNEEPSIAADIGLRMVATGYVIAVFAGMADVFGLDTRPLPGVEPGMEYFGIWQVAGVAIGQVVIALGFFMLIPYHKLTGGPRHEDHPPYKEEKPRPQKRKKTKSAR